MSADEEKAVALSVGVRQPAVAAVSEKGQGPRQPQKPQTGPGPRQPVAPRPAPPKPGK